MTRVWQVAALFMCFTSLGSAAEISWQPLSIPRSMFSDQIGMLDSEREEYSSQLAAYASSRLVAGKGSEESLAQARKILALALQLSPRNKQAMVLNFQLAKGVLPEASGSDSETDALAKLLFARGQQLQKQEGDENLKLARIFIQMAADMDPKNVDVVYASELNRLDYGSVDWAALMNPSN